MTRKKPTKPAAVIHYTPKPFTGVDWTTSLLRPGCQDHLQHPSRRGNDLVPHHNGALKHMTSALQDFGHLKREGKMA